MSELNRIYETDTPIEIANKIFYNFEFGASATITGWMQEGKSVFPKGERVLELLRILDRTTNCRANGNGRGIRRKRYKPPQSIGGYAAEKIFRYKIETINSEIKVTIWRSQ